MKAHIVSLGCPKNLADSEVLMGRLAAAGYSITANPAQAETIIVNTCGFLRSARDESLSVIKEMAGWKNKGKCKKLYVAGCLPKTGAVRGLSRIPVDGVIDSIGLYNCDVPRIKATPPWFAYVKIAEGCGNNCAYCLIPRIRGKLVVRKAKDVLREAKILAKRGIKEIIYVAQDTTAYPDFPGLLKKTARIKGIRWIRIMYAHPARVSDRLIEVIASEKKIVKYLDIPIQHASNKILKLMRRNYRKEALAETINKLRGKIPSISLRTSVIVGFPGETAADFQELLDFIRETRFDRLGAFTYFREKGTPAYFLPGQLPDKIKSARLNQLMSLQSKISKEIHRMLVGKTFEAAVEGRKGKYYFGRTYRDAPDIDGKIFIKSPSALPMGSTQKVVVVGAKTYDIIAATTNLKGGEKSKRKPNPI